MFNYHLVTDGQKLKMQNICLNNSFMSLHCCSSNKSNVFPIWTVSSVLNQPATLMGFEAYVTTGSVPKYWDIHWFDRYSFVLCICCSHCCCVWQTVERLLDLLETLDQWINETPPVDQPSRFGNKAFRTWYAKLDQVGSHSFCILHVCPRGL